MKWEVIINERSSLQEFRLIENNDCKVVLKYNPLHQSARITSGNQHRLVFFETTGSLNGKMVLKNEYGHEIGNLVHDKFHPQEGSFTIDSVKYLYRISEDIDTKLEIYNKDFKKPVVSCVTPPIKKNYPDNFSSNNNATNNNCCLLGLCWLLSQSMVKENELNYA